MWMNGSIRKSERPASRTSTVVPGSALSRLAIAEPAEPPPTTTTSYGFSGVSPRRPLAPTCDLRSVLESAFEPALGRRPHVVPDVLGLPVLLDPGAAQLASGSGLLVAAPLGLRDVGVVVVD